MSNRLQSTIDSYVNYATMKSTGLVIAGIFIQDVEQVLQAQTLSEVVYHSIEVCLSYCLATHYLSPEHEDVFDSFDEPVDAYSS